MKGELLDTSALQIGAGYSRAEVAATGRVTPPVGPRDPHWSTGIVRFDNAVLLFVTLKKEHYSYRDHFDGSLFWWQSQTQQTRRSEVLVAMASAQLEPHLFVRVSDNDGRVTRKFVYCGSLSPPDLEGERPVTALFDSLDFQPDPSAALKEIYHWRPVGQATPADESARKRSLVSSRANRQGRQLNPVMRKAIELHAMHHAIKYYKSLGYRVEDTSATHPYDLVCTRGSERRRVEVKGTQTCGNIVTLTRGEVRAAREPDVVTDLYVLHSISLSLASSGELGPVGGSCCRIHDWIPADDDLTPVDYAYIVPANREALA